MSDKEQILIDWKRIVETAAGALLDWCEFHEMNKNNTCFLFDLEDGLSVTINERWCLNIQRVILLEEVEEERK